MYIGDLHSWRIFFGTVAEMENTALLREIWIGGHSQKLVRAMTDDNGNGQLGS